MLGSKLDAKLKFQLLDWIDVRPVTLIDKMDPVINSLTDSKLEDLLTDKLQYIICDSLFDDMELLLKCRSEAEMIYSEEGMMKVAGFGRGPDNAQDSNIRGDKLIWLTNIISNESTTHLKIDSTKELIDKLEPLIKDKINSILYKIDK